MKLFFLFKFFKFLLFYEIACFKLLQKDSICFKPSFVSSCAKRFTKALPTITASEPHFFTFKACSGSEIPNPTPTGLSVTLRNLGSNSSTRLATC